MLTARSLFLALSLSLSAALLSSCASLPIADPSEVGPFFKASNFRSVATMENVRRVILLPAASNGLIDAGTLERIDANLLVSLQKQNRFECVQLSRAELKALFGVESLNSSDALPLDLLDRLKQRASVDAVLMVDVTHLRAYRPLILSLRAKLIASDDVALLWTFDQTFDASEAAVVNSARRFEAAMVSSRSVPFSGTAVLQSPALYTKFASEEMFSTLPHNRPLPGPTAASKRPVDTVIIPAVRR